MLGEDPAQEYDHRFRPCFDCSRAVEKRRFEVQKIRSDPDDQSFLLVLETLCKAQAEEKIPRMSTIIVSAFAEIGE